MEMNHENRSQSFLHDPHAFSCTIPALHTIHGKKSKQLDPLPTNTKISNQMSYSWSGQLPKKKKDNFTMNDKWSEDILMGTMNTMTALDWTHNWKFSNEHLWSKVWKATLTYAQKYKHDTMKWAKNKQLDDEWAKGSSTKHRHDPSTILYIFQHDLTQIQGDRATQRQHRTLTLLFPLPLMNISDMSIEGPPWVVFPAAVGAGEGQPVLIFLTVFQVVCQVPLLVKGLVAMGTVELGPPLVVGLFVVVEGPVASEFFGTAFHITNKPSPLHMSLAVMPIHGPPLHESFVTSLTLVLPLPEMDFLVMPLQQPVLSERPLTNGTNKRIFGEPGWEKGFTLYPFCLSQELL